MKFGLFIFATDQTIQPVELGRAVEENGFESLWLAEHSHIPVSRKTPWGGRVGAPELPDWYWRVHDPFVALAAVAAVTTRLKLATGITLAAQRDPIWLAKEVASLDHISNGRFIFGVGYGWNKEEMASHGVAYRERRQLLREKIGLMKALWTEEIASYEGELLNLEPSWSWPKPVQQPHPPIILGASPGPASFTDMVDFCDGWVLNSRAGLNSLPHLRALLEEAGRDPLAFEVTIYLSKADPGLIEELAASGVHRVVFRLPQTSPDEVLAAIDQFADVARTLTGQEAA